MEKHSEMRYNNRINIVANAKRCDSMIPEEEKRAQIKELAKSMTPEKRELLIALLGAMVEYRS